MGHPDLAGEVRARGLDPHLVRDGGIVGGQALGYDVVAGFAQNSLFGMGLAAGIALVLLGVMLDRMTARAGGRPVAPNR